MLYVIFWQYFVLSFSDVEASKMKPPGENHAPPPSQQRPPSPLGPPPALAAQQAGSETQSSRDISPAVAAALLQLISQQDAASTLQQRKEPSAVDAPAQGQPPPTWVADSPLKSSEAPAGLVTSVTTTVGQFPKDQDLRFSHGTTHSPSIPFWGRPVYLVNGYSSLARNKRESTERDSLDRKHKKCWIQKKMNVLEREIMIPDFSACWTSCPVGESAWTWGQFVSSVSVYWRTSICYSWSLALFCLINEFMWIEFTRNSQVGLRGRDTQLWKAVVIVFPLKQMIVKSATVPSSYLSVFSTMWSLSALVAELTRDVTGSSKNLSGYIESIDFSNKNTVGLWDFP